jgi:geranylgeranyl reductase family protein
MFKKLFLQLRAMDVHVVGFGCAGSVAALSALRKGYDVYVSEEGRKAGEGTVCTGLVSKETLDFLRGYMDVERIALQKIKKAVLHFGKNQEMEIKHKDGAYVIDRRRMDFLLAKEAERKGAVVEYNERISKLSQYRSENIIGADGANSAVAEHFGFPRIEKFASVATAKIEEKVVERGSVHLYFNKYTRGFFSWIVDQGKRQEVGCGVILPKNVMSAFERFVEEIGVSAKVEESAIIPLRVRKKTGKRIDGRNVILVGDAAGQVKAFSGGGLAYGLRCAELSAEYIKNPEGYEKEWRRRYGMALMQFSILQSMNEVLPVGWIALGVCGLKLFGFEKFLGSRRMDNPLGV